MRNILIHAMLLAVICYGSKEINLNNGRITGNSVLDISAGYFEAEFMIGEISVSAIKTEAGEFIELDFEGSKNSHRVGSPQLPVFRELIQFPASSTPVIKIVSQKEKEYFLDELGIKNRIIPSQPSYSKSTPPEMRDFIFNKNEYREPGYKHNTLASVKKSGEIRGVSMGVLKIEPVSYDAVNNSIKVVSDLKIRVEYSGGDNNWEKTRAENFSPYFESQLKNCMNYTSLSSKENITAYPVTYLIAANEVLENNDKLREFIDWKIQKGFNVITGFFPSTASVNDVDNWVENNYNVLEPKPSFLLLIGDVSGSYFIPTEQNPALGSTGNVSVSDLIYGVIGETSESNRIPSIHVGRFSVNDLTELDAQINKTLWYEKGQFDSSADLSYLSNVMGVAGVDGSYAASHGNPQIHYGMDHYFNDQYQIPLDGSYADITGLAYYYPETTNSSVDAEIISNISSGVAFYNYTAHGSPTAFGDPGFDIFDINSLENTGKYPLVVGNCCLTGSFGYSECFGEAWLNAADKGGVGFIGASMSTYWDEDLAMGVGTASVINNSEPPLSQSEQGMYDGVMMMDYPSQSAVRFAGLLAVEEYGGAMVSPYWSAYHLFGDPSLMVYFGIPGENTVSHDTFISPGADTFTVQALEGSYVAVADSSSGALHGAARADRFGYAVVPVEPFLEGTAIITVTSQFKQPYTANIPVEELTGPYILINDHHISDTDHGSEGKIDIELKNIGVLPSENIQLYASSSSEYISFTDNEENYGNIAAEDSLLKSEILSYIISADVPDNEPVVIDIVIHDSSKRIYESHINFNAKAPVLEFDHSSSEQIHPGGSADISINISNTGSSVISSATAVLSENTGEDVIISGPQSLTSLAPESSQELIFTIDVSSSVDNGKTLKFTLAVTSDKGYKSNYNFDLVAGLTENFETGDFSANDWIIEGDKGWVIDSEMFYAGSYSARSGDITHSESSSMTVNFEFLADGKVRFYRKVSSEMNYDFLKFYIDDMLKDSWSHEQDWEEMVYNISEGSRKLTWTYIKDGSMDGGADCAWVDNILATNILVGIEEDVSKIPSDPVLYQNYPNPFNSATTIKFSLPAYQEVRLNIYNSAGQLVRNVLDRSLDKGMYSVNIDVPGLQSGIYIYSLETSLGNISKKMLYLK